MGLCLLAMSLMGLCVFNGALSAGHLCLMGLCLLAQACFNGSLFASQVLMVLCLFNEALYVRL